MRYFGVPVRITELYRTPARQRWLYGQGRERPGHIVTWTLNSRHMQGRAFDIVPVDPAYANAPEFWDFARQVGEALGMRSGAGYGDYGHFEI